MLFNSLEFFLFLPTVFILYWLVIPQKKAYQNIVLLVASYVFYGWWDWRFLSLILLSTVTDYILGLQIHNTENETRQKWLLRLSLLINLGLLGFFKYYNFFIESWVDAFAGVGIQTHVSTLQIILPVGISFYTFQTLSYTLDIYKGVLRPTKSFLDFATFVAFFPQLVAGPIERASNFLPQIARLKTFDFDKGREGLRLILWGLFKKVVIADSLAGFTDDIFGNYETASGSELFLGAIYFAIQMYGDFSGYTDIAIGTAKLFGVELMSNFKFPYFSRNVSEYWNRWHVSLSTWFNDYVYLPLAIQFRYWGKTGTALAIMITFLVSGLWHGAAWTFVLWGFIHGLLYLPLIFRKGMVMSISSQRAITAEREQFQIVDYLKMVYIFVLISFTLVIFRASSVSMAGGYFYNMVTKFDGLPQQYRTGMIYVIVMLVLDFLSRPNERVPFSFLNRYRPLRIAVYYIITALVLYSIGKPQQFIYFQF